jgi:hypothetical protein
MTKKRMAVARMEVVKIRRLDIMLRYSKFGS